jgi:hypothetical protein
VPTLPDPRDHGLGSTARNPTPNQPSTAHQLRNPGSGLDEFLALPADIVPGAADCSFSFSAFSMERVANGDVAV